ncbi:MAG: hypothetical protein WA971_09240, partial [Microbacterium sp.]
MSARPPSSRLLATPSPVDRSLGRLIAIAAVVVVVIEAQRVGTQAFTAWWGTIALACVATLIVLAVLGGRLPSAVLRAAWGLLPATLLLLQLTSFAGYVGDDPEGLLPWSWRLEWIGLLLLLLVARPAIGVGYAVLSAFAPMLSGLAVLGHVPGAVGPYVAVHLGVLAYVPFFLALRDRFARARRAERDARRRRRDQERAAVEAARLSALTRMVHDEVLATLIAAIRLPGRPPVELRGAAARALDALE